MLDKQELKIDLSIRMYEIAARLFQSGMVTDSNTVAAKARNLMDKGLEGLIDKVEESN